MKPENKPKLVQILTYHVVAGNFTAEAIINLHPPVNVTTLDVYPFLVTLDGINLKVNDANVIIPNIFATNGIIHVIDTVLFPPVILEDIVETAIDNGNFKTLVAALELAGLTNTLEGPGPFTVFAPTDTAFAKLPPGIIGSLFRPENKAKLIEILTYHVVAGNFTAEAIINLHPPVNVTTLDVYPFLVTQNGKSLKVNDANVIIPNIFAKNGIIHVIDTVLFPPVILEDIVQTAIDNGNFKTLVTALELAGLTNTLEGPGPFTVFAPTDVAFAKLPPGSLADLFRVQNRAKLSQILTYHVISGNLTAEAIISLRPPVKLITIEGSSVLASLNGTNLKINDATVIIPDVFATNGLIHAIDTVLTPP